MAKRKLTDGQVDEIRARYASGGETIRSLACEYGVSEQVTRMVIIGVAHPRVVRMRFEAEAWDRLGALSKARQMTREQYVQSLLETHTILYADSVKSKSSSGAVK